MRFDPANLKKLNWSTMKKWIVRAIIFGGGGGFVLGAIAFTYAYVTVGIPDANAFVNSQSTIIEYADGTEIGRLGSENRQIVKLANIPINVRRAVLAAEDANFYNESAVSPTGLIRAVLSNVTTAGGGSGGSTITQQYAKTAFLSSERTITRKIKELVIAIKLGQQMSKDQILENYLNTIWFGRGSYGVQTASQVFFGTTVDHLSISQAAVLASILNSPGYYDPANGPASEKRLQERWKYVITNMEKHGWITHAQATNAKFPTIKPRVRSGALAGPKGYVISWVVNELGKLGFTEAQLQTGGYVIKTTLEKNAQEAAVNAVDKKLPAKLPDNLRVGLVSIRPGTGEIVAMYGGRDYLVSQLNNATQSVTQAGSTFKPFALIAALEQGIPISSVWNGASPKVFDDAGKVYPVYNYNSEQFGNVDLVFATAHSINTIFVPLGIKAGPDKIVDVARRAGIPTSVALMPTPSISLGVASPHVIDVASAYATFAANGIYAKPFIVKEVLGNNQGVLYESRIEAQQLFQPDVMADLDVALQAVTSYGTAASAGATIGRPSAGKTGTTTDNASAWFNGYTPQLATSVALFKDDATQSLNGLGGVPSVTGGTFPASIWAVYMKAALKDLPKENFPTPANIGGSDPVNMVDAVPTLDPSLAPPLSKTKKKK